MPNSAGTGPPTLEAPANACDCHHHIYDEARFPPATPGGRFQPNARVEEYRLLQQRLGTTRSVIVTPAPYGPDNAVTADALVKFGPNARGVALLSPDVTGQELKRLADGGFRGVRVAMANPATGGAGSIEALEPTARLAAGVGWHVQLAMRADQIVAAADILNRLPTPMVFDHLGMLGPLGAKHPAFAVIRRLMDKRKAWVKLSGAYIQTVISADGSMTVGYTKDYTAATRAAQAFVQASPERLVWGSDWPHPGLGANEKADDAELFDLLRVWAPNAATRHRILVENPEALYGFTNVRADRSVGTWKFNPAQSTSNSRNQLLSRTEVIEAMPDGWERVTRTDQRADGTSPSYSYTFKYDGREYPVSGALFDSIAQKRLDANTTAFEVKKAGSPYHAKGRVVLSKDGKQRTQTEKGIASDGKPFETMRIYHKQ